MKQAVWITGLLTGSILGSYCMYGEVRPYSVLIGAGIGGIVGWMLKIGKDKDDEDTKLGS